MSMQSWLWIEGLLIGSGTIMCLFTGVWLVLSRTRLGREAFIGVVARNRELAGGCERLGHEFDDDGWCGWCDATKVLTSDELAVLTKQDFDEWRRSRYGVVDGGEASFLSVVLVAAAMASMAMGVMVLAGLKAMT